MLNMREKFSKDIGGNMTAMFAGVVFLCLAGAGAAVDVTGIMSQKARLQSYADMAVLSAASSDKKTKEELNSIAEAVVNANKREGEAYSVVLNILDDSSLRVSVRQDYPMVMMSIFGVKTKPIDVIAEAPPKGGTGKINLALVLDATDSMTGSKMAALKSAAVGLVDDLDGASNQTTQFSIVPFARYVKLPTSYSSASWINIAASGEECWNTLDVGASTNCTTYGTGESAYTTCDNEVYRETCMWKDWDGCMGSRKFPWYERDDVGPKKLQGFVLGDWCGDGNQLLTLTDNIDTVKTKINGLTTNQDTYIPSGLIWGWRSLTPEAPLTDADTADYDARSSALILMTDGQNTQSFGGEEPEFDGVYHWGGDPAAANATTANLCDNIKADGITIYTIAFEVIDSTTQTLLSKCASSVNKYYDAGNATELAEAFDSIGRDLSTVRLSR